MFLARVVLFLAQFGHLGHFFCDNDAYTNSAASTAAHVVTNNVLHVAFVLLFCHSFFYSAEVILILNFVNLSALYFRQGPHARSVQHLPSSGPLAWTFVSIYWNLAIALAHRGVETQIFGLIFIWSPLGYGLFAFIAYKDVTMIMCLGILAAATGVGQLSIKAKLAHLIPPFLVAGLLLVLCLLAAIAGRGSETIGNNEKNGVDCGSPQAEDEESGADEQMTRERRICSQVCPPLYWSTAG
ncbi:hypothetical protein JDV02_003126 [Purpureocillium takamizusanense]|uniref:DUF1774-domain-containing protein n=1 Tax=Purpureocillium takamizusanense TaxID=2060973 RepID=A0A9Q8V9F1_9HYPO|nr:uncharacterized protein JDV02_003126 [Purpureocillium takamizusanense]UNI16712.1 hypothetical protein JDV02_003126 [Purpureocillium takamizusanense]